MKAVEKVELQGGPLDGKLADVPEGTQIFQKAATATSYYRYVRCEAVNEFGLTVFRYADEVAYTS